MDYFSFHHSTYRTFNRQFEALFGPPRSLRADFHGELTRESRHYADIAASVQKVTEEILLAMARTLQRDTGLRKLCMAGGVALNSVANGRILRETPFDDVYIQPSAGDGGGAIGAALYAHHTVLGNPRRFVMEHAFLGEAHGPDVVERFLRRQNVSYARIDDEQRLIERVVDRLQRGSVVGWSQGRFEWGPRSLGNRSILADPRRGEMKEIVNAKIKFREPFRPFAPSVPVERAEDYFVLPDAPRHYPARFMLYVVDVRAEKQAVIPAVPHVDGTGRLQTVSEAHGSRYYKLIETFGKATGVPVLLNTSFNLRGEPIVNTPAEAFDTFHRSGMDMLVLGDCVVEKPTAR
jgi:carbamoyltransferase